MFKAQSKLSAEKMQARIPAGIPIVSHQTKLIQLSDQQDSSGVFTPIHYRLLNFCKQSFPARNNIFYLWEIRSVLWNKKNVLWENNPRQEFAYLREDIEYITDAPENSVRRLITEVMTLYKDIQIIRFPSSDHIYGDFVPIYSDLSDVCQRFYGRRSNRFLLSEIQLVLLTDIRFNAFKRLTEGIHIYLVDLLNRDRELVFSPQGNLVWLVNCVKGYVRIWTCEEKLVHPGQGNQIMALVEDLRPLTVYSQKQWYWQLTLRLSSGTKLTYADVLSNLVYYLLSAQRGK